MDSVGDQVLTELLPLLRVYKNGTVERLIGGPPVPTSPEDPETGVSSKDIKLSDNPPISARLYLPKLREPHHKLPVLVYFHGGGFCIESAFSFVHHKYLNRLVSEAQIVAVSVEYRLAPEHLLPAAYEDCWAALQWVASLSVGKSSDKEEPWLTDHGDFERFYIGGDSSGANIVHNIAMRAGVDSLHGGVKITGAFLTHPYFWGSKPIGSEPIAGHETALPYAVWSFVYPSVAGGIDSPLICPVGPEAPSLAGLACLRLLVSVSEKDELRDRGVWYCDAVKKSGWKGEVELVEVEGEDHAFQIVNYESENAMILIKRLASFLLQ